MIRSIGEFNGVDVFHVLSDGVDYFLPCDWVIGLDTDCLHIPLWNVDYVVFVDSFLYNGTEA